jgi:prepilin peptidase CpaA
LSVNNDILTWLGSQGNLVLPLILAIWIAWGDIRTRRIPNYLTLGTAIGGLTFNLAFHGGTGLLDGFLGMALGFGFLIIIYAWGGMGAGDVKALAALGAWLGLDRTLYFCCYMGIAGGVLALAVLIWKGMLWQLLQRGWAMLINLVLCQPLGMQVPDPPAQVTEGIPYGVAMALGMMVMVGIGG